MSFVQQLQNISGTTPMNRRRALLGLFLFCSYHLLAIGSGNQNRRQQCCLLHLHDASLRAFILMIIILLLYVMPGMMMRSPAGIQSTPIAGRYWAAVTPDMVGDWNGVIQYDGPRGWGETHLSFSVKN